MPFWRVEFLLLLAASLLALRLSRGPASRRVLLILAGLYFYAWWDLRFLPLLIGAALLDWAVALGLARAGGPGQRRALFLAGLACRLGLLAFFKYADFFLAAAPGSSAWLILPLGLSFQTFSAITYLAGVYAGRLAARANPLDVLCLATFFPTLAAGPIVRAEELLPQLDVLAAPTAGDLYDGFRRFAMGLFKKLVIADRLGLYVAEIYGNAGAYDAASTWAAALAYALQIYLDFSGYSDMAVGVGRMLGLRLPENFDFPYAARNPAEFWRRWHMSLSAWIRDYVYIPLGGSRQGRARTLANILLAMLLCGVWHGSGWTFVLWGGLHGLGLCLHRLWRERSGRHEHSTLSGLLSWAGCTLFAGLCWIPFRAEDLPQARRIIAALFQGGPTHWVHPFVWAALGLTLAAHLLRALGREDALMLRGKRWYAPAALLSLVWLAVIFAAEGFTPFLYAQF